MTANTLSSIQKQLHMQLPESRAIDTRQLGIHLSGGGNTSKRVPSKTQLQGKTNWVSRIPLWFDILFYSTVAIVGGCLLFMGLYRRHVSEPDLEPPEIGEPNYIPVPHPPPFETLISQ